MRLWLGGYAPNAAGIGTLLAGVADEASAGGALAFAGAAAVVAGSPSWLARHPSMDVVYAALESSGQVAAFARSGEATLAPLGPPVAAGEAVCHAAVAPDGGSLVASCYGDGRVVRMALDADGRPSSPVAAVTATDPYAVPEASGARGSRAHAAAFLPDGRVATTDLGFDLVRIWRQSATGLRPDHDIVLPRGSGPRHIVVHPSGHLHVVTEYSLELFTLGPDRAGRWVLVGGTVSASQALPGFDTAAELARSRDGEFLYAGLRGSDSIATLRVHGGGGSVEPVAQVEAGVDRPRHHAVVRDVLLVAGQRSNEVVSLTLDPRTGVPGRVRHRTRAPSPTCILPDR